MFDLTIAIVNITFFFALAGAYLLRSAVVGRRRHARTESDGGSVFLNKTTMEMVYWILDPIIDFLAALHITPNMITLFSLLPAAGAGVALGFGWFGLASLLAVIATFCDILDGLVARKTARLVGGGRGAGRRGRPLQRDVLLRRARLLLPVARPGAVHRAGGDHRLVHGQLRDRQGRGDGRRRPRAARCAGASARRI